MLLSIGIILNLFIVILIIPIIIRRSLLCKRISITILLVSILATLEWFSPNYPSFNILFLDGAINISSTNLALEI